MQLSKIALFQWEIFWLKKPRLAGSEFVRIPVPLASFDLKSYFPKQRARYSIGIENKVKLLERILIKVFVPLLIHRVIHTHPLYNLH